MQGFNREIEYEKQKQNNKINNIKCRIYEELLASISELNINKLIKIAKDHNDNFVVIYSVLELVPTYDQIKELILNFDPYGLGTIYDLLLKHKYRVGLVERSFVFYECILYVYWVNEIEKISFWDSLNYL